MIIDVGVMRRINLFLFLCMFIASQAQDSGSIKLSLPEQEYVSELSLSDGKIEFHFTIREIHAKTIDKEGDKYILLSIPGYSNSGIPGEPLLPEFSSLVEKNMPSNYTMNLTGLDSVIIDLNEDFSGSFILPAQPSLQKGLNIQQQKFLTNETLYNSDGWIVLSLIEFEDEGRMRGLDIGRFSFNPIYYKPGENKIKVFYNIQGELVPDESIEIIDAREPSKAFDRVMSSVIQEDRNSTLKKLIKDEPLTLVILSDTIFRNTLQPFIKWKEQKGFRVIEAYTDEPQVGKDRESIKTFLSGQFSSPPAGYASPSYLLIVGDVEHVPLSQSGGQITDLFYTTFDGPDDYLPELIQGRISVKNESELNSVLSKIMEYEKYLFPEDDFLSKSILIAGSGSGYPATYGNGQINYASNYYFNEAHNISANVNLHPAASSQGTEIRNAIAEGTAFVNYTGHGEESGWIDPSFKTGHISLMQNRGKYPLLIGNGCRTNVFSRSSGDCFAEAVVKAENKGAIAYIGCTNDSYWMEDFYWSVGIGPETANPTYETTTYGFYDKVFHEGNEADSIWSPSLGEMIFAGNMSVQQSSSTHKEYYWKIYQLMGDPTMVPWFAIPKDTAVIFPASLPAEASLVNIEALPYDCAAISVRDSLLDAKHADGSGLASLLIPEAFRGDTILLVVTGDRRKPFIRQIPDLGYLELIDIEIVNESVLADSILSNGEQAAFNITLTNSASNPSEEHELIFRNSGNGVVIIDSLANLPIVAAGDTIELINVFPFQVPEDVTDQTEDFLTFVRSGDITSNFLHHTIQFQAPELSVKSYSIKEDGLGNGNGMIEAGETVNMSVDLSNLGSYGSDSIIIQFASSDTLFSSKHILTGSPIDTGETLRYSADIVIPEFEESADFFLVPIYIGDGNYLLDSLIMVVGKYFEDFSTDSLSILPWMEMDWVRDTTEYYNGPASLRSADIGNRESSSFKIKVHVFEDDSISFNFKVSSEAGYDYLMFYVDEEEIQRWSGDFGWANYSHKLSNGLHLVEWMYKKDLNTSTGRDAAWVDDIVFPNHSFVPDLYIDSIYIIRSGSFIENKTMKVDVVNIGLDTINNFSIRYRNNDESWNEVSFETALLSGSKELIVLPNTIDLSEVRDHFLQVVVRSEADIWPWNDTLSTFIDHYEYPDLSISYIDHDTLNRDFVNLKALVENKGNIPADGFYYDVLIDEEFRFSGKSSIILNPGESAEASLNLINIYYDWLGTGWHNYRVELAEDSVAENNSVGGSIFWLATNLDQESVFSIRIYPNPVSEVLHIEAIGDLQFPCRLSITDVLGREVLLRELNTETEQIQVGGSLDSDGFYNINIQDRNGESAFSGRFIYLK